MRLLIVASLFVALLQGCDLGPGEPDPLLEAVSGGDVEEVRRRLDDGADPNQSFDGFTLVTDAAGSGSLETVRLLLDRGADPNRTGHDNWTPLMMLALHTDEAEVAELLLSKGADPCIRHDAEAMPGKTAHDVAVAKAHHRVADVLRAPTEKC